MKPNTSSLDQLNQQFHGSLYLAIQSMRGRPIGAFMRRLEAWERLDQASYDRLVQTHLREALEYARQRVPLYSTGAWAKAFARTDPADIHSWPVLERQVVIECAEDLHAWPRLRGVAYRQSSASTGRPLRVAWDRVASAWNWANEYRGTLWHGIPIGIKTLMLWGFGSTLASWILNRKLYLTKNLTAAKLDEAAQYLLNQHPRLIRGYPSAVAQVARYIGTNYPQAPRPVVPFVKVGGEQVFPFQIQEIERYLGARVVQSYGCSEAGSIAMQCSRGALHVFGLQTHVEIFREGEPAQPGELGEVVATSLTNRAMPLVRCRIGDRGRLSPEPCPCGLPYPVLTDLQGRTSDLFLAADGGKVHGSAIPRAMEAYIGIAPLGTVRQVLFQQIDQRSWKVLVENDIDPGEALRSQVSGIIRQNFGPDCRVETEVVSFIPREASGKFRYYRTATAALYDQEKQV